MIYINIKFELSVLEELELVNNLGMLRKPNKNRANLNK